MKTKTLYFFVSLILVLSLSTSVQASPLGATPFFVPDMTEAQFAGAVNDTGASIASLPELIPFWVDLVNAEAVRNDGEGVYVAVLDTGLVPLWPFFFSQANIAEELGKGFTHDVSWDDTLGDIVFGPLRDDRGFITELASGHGTHVTSTVVGFNYNDIRWVQGVAPRATIIPVLVLDGWEVASPYGTLRITGGTDEMIAAGIRYVAELSETLDGPVVINMSLGGPDPSPMIEDAINYAIAKGVIVVASAGNNGTDGMGYPGGLAQVISAGAGGWADMFNQGWYADVPEKLNSRDSLGNNSQHYLEDFSSRPNKYLDQKTQDLDVTAPGAWIVGPYRPAFSGALAYYYVSGTSMAAPHVSAIASLVLESKPLLMQAQMEKILSLGASGLPFSADDAIVAYPYVAEGYYFATWDGGDYGAGLLRADAALKSAKVR
ncbi:MAG: S8 family serine peptidase [Chromatiaceae bacterium]|nr:S8 family serine peptidase [Candidatus Thioaporhodococcus sediminis]